MKIKLNRILALFAAGALPLLASFAETYTSTEGSTFDGTIYKVFEGAVFLRVGDETVSLPVSDFDVPSQASIEAWVAKNPQAAEVYTKWDVQPRIKSSAMPSLPEEFLASDFKGLVSVDLVLDEGGQVIHASIKKSTHFELEAPSLEAAKTWMFEPAQVGGKSVKSKLRVPFKFVFMPSVPEEVPVS